MRAEKGFTLLEVMIALAVFATLAAAVMSASQYVLGQSARVEARLFAGWLADNQLNELHLQAATLAVGSRSFNQRFAQREWRVVQQIVSEPASGLLRVELSVSPAASDQTLLNVTHWLARNHD
ncbi:type II secretion system protein GspI [Pseudomonas endophytica]|uniref:Type II secretion system protein I n=1 Tax=Pseudomonas endophytica TaxID=1563157 RepID=A0A0Q0XND5_9PSED|nr:type II secretion system minor pseudopilin GspI [Pseudomonas endophytica]KQB51605.1 type II secretion system protein GspI [Pseudomonas endophytica]